MARKSSGYVIQAGSEDLTFKRELEKIGFSQYGLNSVYTNPKIQVKDINHKIRICPIDLVHNVSGASCSIEQILKDSTSGAHCLLTDKPKEFEPIKKARTALDEVKDMAEEFGIIEMSEDIFFTRYLHGASLKEFEKLLKEHIRDIKGYRSRMLPPIPVTRTIPLPKGECEVKFARKMTEEIFSTCEKLPNWDDTVLDKLPPLQWGKEFTPDHIRVETERKYRKANPNRLGGLKLEHPEMQAFKADRIVKKDDELFISGREYLGERNGKPGYARRIVPAKELFINGSSVADLMSIFENNQALNEMENQVLYTGKEEFINTNPDLVYHHSTFGFVLLIGKDPLSDMAIIRQLVPDERQLVAHKFDLTESLFGDDNSEDTNYKKASSPRDLGVHIVYPSEIISFKGFKELGVKSENRYAIYSNLPDADSDEIPTPGSVWSSPEFVMILQDLPLQPKLNENAWVVLRDQQGEIVNNTKGIPIMVHPQAEKIVEMFDERIGLTVTKKMKLWESPRVLVIGEDTGRIQEVPASWLYKITGNNNKVYSDCVDYAEIPSVCAWEDKTTVDNYSFTLRRKGKDLGKPEPGSFSILPEPAPGKDYKNESIPVRTYWNNTERYKWENPKRKSRIIQEDIPTGAQIDDYELYATVADIPIDVGVIVIEEPTVEEIKTACNQQAWYWQEKPVSAREIGLSNITIAWVNNEDTKAIVCFTSSDKEISVPIRLSKPGELTVDIQDKTLAAYICRLVSFEAAKIRIISQVS